MFGGRWAPGMARRAMGYIHEGIEFAFIVLLDTGPHTLGALASQQAGSRARRRLWCCTLELQWFLLGV